MDKFYRGFTGMSDPITNGFQITPSNTENLPFVTRGINVATSGYVHLTTVEGDDVIIFVAAGSIFPIRCIKIWVSGTDAVDIVGLY